MTPRVPSRGAPEPRGPDFVIVGAPKCGTTAMSEYLRAHPNVFLTTPKEPLFFCEDFSGLLRPRTLEEYLELFRNAPADSCAGEASAMYLYSDVAIENLHRCFPDARLIAMFRSPVELVHAFHSEMFYSQNEDEPDFECAWELQEDRRAGLKIPPHCWEPRFLQYREVGRLGSQYRRLLGHFPPERVLPIVFDDFARDTAAVYRRVLAFLDLSDDGRREFPRMNENKRLRWPGLGRWTQRPPRFLSRALASAKRGLGLEGVHVLGPLRRANLERGAREALSPAMRAHLIETFADEVEALSRLLGRDLSAWLPREPAG